MFQNEYPNIYCSLFIFLSYFTKWQVASKASCYSLNKNVNLIWQSKYWNLTNISTSKYFLRSFYFFILGYRVWKSDIVLEPRKSNSKCCIFKFLNWKTYHAPVFNELAAGRLNFLRWEKILGINFKVQHFLNFYKRKPIKKEIKLYTHLINWGIDFGWNVKHTDKYLYICMYVIPSNLNSLLSFHFTPFLYDR